MHSVNGRLTRINLKEIALIIGVPLIVFGYLFIKIFNSSDNSTGISLILLIFAFVGEKYYVGRMSILPNAVLLCFFGLIQWNQLPQILQLYALGGIIFGGLALFSYKLGISLGGVFRRLAYGLYSLKSIMPIYLTGMLIGLNSLLSVILWMVLFSYSWWVALTKLGHKNPLDLKQSF